MEFLKKKLEILKNPQTFKLETVTDEETMRNIYDKLKLMDAKDIICQFEKCGNPNKINFNFETISEDFLKSEIQKTENKIKKLEEKEKEDGN